MAEEVTDEIVEPAAPEAAAPEAPVKLDAVKPKGPRLPLPSSLQEIVGALLFASESPLSAAELRTCIRGVAPEEGEDAEVMSVYQSCTSREIEQALHGLEKELERSGCGFHLVCAGGAYRLQTNPACGRHVRALLKLDRPNRLSRAALETLAIIAYRQPITKAEIEQIRGVAVDTIVKSLVDLQLVRLVGRSELPGHPFLYGTSPLFLEHFGLASLSELNEIDPTLQRSNPRERAKLFVKEKKVEEAPVEERPAEAVAEAEAASAPVAAEPEVEEDVVEEAEAAPARRVSFRPDDDDEALIDDTPDDIDDADDDESLLDDDEDDEDDDAEEEEEEGEDDE
ncbi:MAG: SMC-Scp complex subunit ScpB [Kiritimatiellia bacterium]